MPKRQLTACLAQPVWQEREVSAQKYHPLWFDARMVGNFSFNRAGGGERHHRPKFSLPASRTVHLSLPSPFMPPERKNVRGERVTGCRGDSFVKIRVDSSAAHLSSASSAPLR